MTVSRVLIALAFAVILALPYALRPAGETKASDAEMLVIISPHPQTIWYEFERGFSRWHEEHFGKPVVIDWRSPGGTSAIAEYLGARYTAVDAIDKTKTQGIGIDVFFGGGDFDHNQEKTFGHTEPAGIATQHPELLDPAIFPQDLAGTALYDKDDYWYGCCLSTFGILSNLDALRRQGAPADLIPPKQWIDLTRPTFFRQVSVADPTMSGSIVKAFEMVLQQQIAETIRARTAGAGVDRLDPAAEQQAIADGFWRGMRLIQIIGANARRIARASGETPIEVAQGDALAGMCIDYYGLMQGEMVNHEGQPPRVVYVTPEGGSAVGSDPVSILRGAPHREIARRFVYFCLAPEGQKLWCYRPGVPGGPVRYPLHRPPVRRDLYTPESLALFADPDLLPYEHAKTFTYHGEWTGPLFSIIRIFLRAMIMDTDRELHAAWADILDAGQTDPAMPAMQALQAMPVTYEQLMDKEFRARLKAPGATEAIVRQWSEHFRRQYAEASRLARAAKRGAQ